MALKTVPLVVDDIEFQTTQFPAMKALEVMVSLQKLAAPLQAMGNAELQLSAAAPGLMASLNPQDAKRLVLDLLQCTTALIRNPQAKLITLDKQEAIDLVFSGKLKLLFKVIGHSIEVNFGDFNEGSDDPAPQTPTLGQ